MCAAKPFAGQGAGWQIRDVDAELARNETDLLDPRGVLFFNRLLFHGTPSHASLGAEACPARCLRSRRSFPDHSGGSLCGLWQRGQGHHPLVFVQDFQEDDAGTARKTATSVEAIVTEVVKVVPEVMVKAVFSAALAAFALKRASGTAAIDEYRYRLYSTPCVSLETVAVSVTGFDAGLVVPLSGIFGVSLSALDVNRTGNVTRSVSLTPVIAIP